MSKIERKIIFNKDDLPIEFCIIIKSKEFCINIDKKRFDKIFQDDLQKQYDINWEKVKEKSKVTHTSRLLERYKEHKDLKGC